MQAKQGEMQVVRNDEEGIEDTTKQGVNDKYREGKKSEKGLGSMVKEKLAENQMVKYGESILKDDGGNSEKFVATIEEQRKTPQAANGVHDISNEKEEKQSYADKRRDDGGNSEKFVATVEEQRKTPQAANGVHDISNEKEEKQSYADKRRVRMHQTVDLELLPVPSKRGETPAIYYING
ncbi:hypothetical protein IFM89_019728 [Coptis chinensis]|uniref:Uncharacterized protein n=1 Tax=Coptis chinensis TaxID=261450 RepID=A0A835H5I1_9MAGN|nr:hypothetical protein IFM89_019728 [Coptis chinensis]